MRQRGLAYRMKRVMDLAVAVPAVVVAAPVMAGVSAAVWATMGRPILFRQRRVGQGEREFEIWKFRTMRTAPADVPIDQDADRITRLGALLRKTSLDELPQLINVIRGEMSLVGPRPLLTQYLPRYSQRQRQRQQVMPGLTGWAQVHGRNSVSWEEKFEHDVWYVENWHPLLDASILARTVAALVRANGVSAEGHATMTEFMGSKEE